CVTFFDRRADNRTEAVNRMILVDDVPNLHEIGILGGELAHELEGLIRRVDLDYGRIAEIELRSRDAGDQRAGDGDARRFCGCVCNLANLEIPKWPPNIDN